MIARVRSATAVVASLLLVLAPWPAWAQTVRVVAPLSNVAPLSGVAPPLEAPARDLPALSIGAPSAPSLQAFGAPAPLERAAIPSALAASAPALPAAATPETPNPVPVSPLPGASAVQGAASAPLSAGFAAEAEVRGKTVVMVGTKSSRPFILQEALRVAEELGLTLVLVDDPANRKNSAGAIPDSRFIAAPINTRDGKTMNKIAESVAAHPEGSKAYAVVSFMSLYASLTGKVTDRLGAKGIAGDVVSAADRKPEARKRLNTDASQRVPYAEIRNEKQAREAYHAISEDGKYKVMLKTSRGENSRFLDLNIKSENEAAASYLKMDAAVRDFVARPEAKQTTFSSHPGIMMERMLEKIPGTEETSVEVVMQGGKAAFAIVSDTKGLGQKGELAGGIMVFPSQQSKVDHRELIAAAERALKALGLTDGSARLDMFATPEGPRVIEINPFMGSVAIWSAVKSLTGMSLVEQGLRATLGLPVDPGHAPDGVIHYIFLASSRNGTLEGVEGLDAARKLPGVELARVFVEPGDSIVAAKGNAYEEWAEIIGKGRTWREAINASLAAARRMVLRIKRANGEIVRARGDYQQPTADDLAPLSPPKPAEIQGPAANVPVIDSSPKLLSKAVVGFLSTFLLVSTVVESTSLAVSQMTQPLSQGFLALAALTSVSYGAYTVGSFLGGAIIKRVGIRATYRGVLAARALIWTSLALLFNPATGTIALAALIPLFSLDYFFHSIGRVAEHSLQVAWFQNSETKSSRFGSFRDFIEYGTVFIGSAMALVVAAVGFGAVIYPAPIAFGLAAVLALGLALPKAGADKTSKGKWSDGFKTIFKDSGIYKPLFGFALVNSFLYMMYYIVATAFGAYATPDPQHAAAVAGSLTGVYGVGALIGAVVMDRLAARIAKTVETLPEGERKAGERRLYAESAGRVLPWAAAALLGSWLLTSTLHLGTLLWPMFPVSIALLAIGFTAQLASNHLDTIMKSNIPKENKDVSVGAIRALIYLSHVCGFLLWGGLFAWLGTGAFAAFAAFYTAAAAAYLWLARSLKR